MVFVECLGGFATVARGETKLGAVFVFCPEEHSFPEFSADTLTTNGGVGDEIFEIG